MEAEKRNFTDAYRVAAATIGVDLRWYVRKEDDARIMRLLSWTDRKRQEKADKGEAADELWNTSASPRG